MPTLDDYARQSRFSDPGARRDLLSALPSAIPELSAVVRNVIVHYRASGIQFTTERLAEINNRWISRILDVDQSRHSTPLAAARSAPDRVAGCCRDFTLLTVAALRHQGVPARSRIGFAAYFEDDFCVDHVLVEYHDGDRWIDVDAQLDPSRDWGFDPIDMPPLVGAALPAAASFDSAARVWMDWRAGRIDDQRYGVSPDIPARGGWFIMNYVISELAHRQRDELLLWDGWGAMAPDLPDDLSLIDEIAALLLAADGGDSAAEAELAARYAVDERLRPSDRVLCLSPDHRVFLVDLHTRHESPIENSQV